MNLFDGYDWTECQVVRVKPVNAVAAEHRLIDHVNPKEYQLGVKFHGRTEILFSRQQLLFDTGTVLYLPKCTDPTVPYSKNIRENGTGVCIFFTSKNPLPLEAVAVKCAGFPLEMFTHVLNAWRTVGGELSCLGAFYSLLGEIRRMTREHEAQENDSDLSLAEVRAYLENHVSDPYPDIRQMASFCRWSTEYFRQRFQKKWGVTPQRYLAELKMTHARRLLADSASPVCDIAAALGFSDANYFSRFFRRHEGITPLEYRQRYSCGSR